MCRHRYSSLTCDFSGVRIGEERRNVLWGEGSYWREGSVACFTIMCQEYFSINRKRIGRYSPCLRPVFACPSGRRKCNSSAPCASVIINNYILCFGCHLRLFRVSPLLSRNEPKYFSPASSMRRFSPVFVGMAFRGRPLTTDLGTLPSLNVGLVARSLPHRRNESPVVR